LLWRRVDLKKVDRLSLLVRAERLPARWCRRPSTAVSDEPLPLGAFLPKGSFWTSLGRAPSINGQAHRRSQSSSPACGLSQPWLPASACRSLSRLGAAGKQAFAAAGFFHTLKDEKRWWLVDPDGYAFWSSGLDCVRVDTEAVYSGLETALTWLPDPSGDFAIAYEQHGEQKAFNYLAANFIRAFGKENWYARWAEITLAELRRLGFNTVANWSDWQIASQSGTPYVRPLPSLDSAIPLVYRDFPDVFHPAFPQAALAFAEPLRETASDPALIGYFLMNEPTWGLR
jgi:hypothetical protein